MFIGHYGASFVAAAHPKAPRLGTLFIAAQLVDIGFFSFLLIGVEHMRLVPGITRMSPFDLYDMPWTHSLIGALGWSVAFAILIRLLRGGWAAAAIGGAVVFSHWLIDLLVHRPDLTIAGGEPKFGLGLWNHPEIEIPLELAFAYGGLLFFASRTIAKSAAGRWSLIVLAIAMAVLQAYNWFGPHPAAIVDPAPASGAALGLFAYGILAAIAWWAGNTREPAHARKAKRAPA